MRRGCCNQKQHSEMPLNLTHRSFNVTNLYTGEIFEACTKIACRNSEKIDEKNVKMRMKQILFFPFNYILRWICSFLAADFTNLCSILFNDSDFLLQKRTGAVISSTVILSALLVVSHSLVAGCTVPTFFFFTTSGFRLCCFLSKDKSFFLTQTSLEQVP